MNCNYVSVSVGVMFLLLGVQRNRRRYKSSQRSSQHDTYKQNINLYIWLRVGVGVGWGQNFIGSLAVFYFQTQSFLTLASKFFFFFFFFFDTKSIYIHTSRLNEFY